MNNVAIVSLIVGTALTGVGFYLDFGVSRPMPWPVRHILPKLLYGFGFGVVGITVIRALTR